MEYEYPSDRETYPPVLVQIHAIQFGLYKLCFTNCVIQNRFVRIVLYKLWYTNWTIQIVKYEFPQGCENFRTSQDPRDTHTYRVT